MFQTTSNIESNLNYYNKLKGKVLDKGIILNSSNVSGKSKIKNKIFSLVIEHQEKPFGIYKSSGDYKDLASQINKNDFITIYFKNNPSTEINLDVFQIEKNNKIVYDLKNYIWKERLGGIIAFIGGLVLLFLTIKDLLIKK